MDTDIIIIILAIIILSYFFINKNKKNMVYVKSPIDDELYLVRDLSDKQDAANMLAKIKQNIITLTKYLFDHKDEYKENKEYISQLNSRTRNIIIMENDGDYQYTSYSINKGEQLVFCLRTRSSSTEKLHSLNKVMYVVLHEMSHIACPEIGHGKLFKKIFAFIATVGIQINLYQKIDFANSPEEYCGLTINESII